MRTLSLDLGGIGGCTGSVQRALSKLNGVSHVEVTLRPGMVSWVSNYDFVTFATIAASPFAQTPALILAALLGLPRPEMFGVLLLGKGLKYSPVGAVTAHTTCGPQGSVEPS